MSSKIKVDTIENVAGSGNVSLGSGHNLVFADNGKAIFGNSSDLSLYHDGSNSYIIDNGTGDLVINTNGNAISLNTNGGGEYGLRVLNNGAVNLYHDNALKLATSATGVAVTGTVTADGLTVDGTGGQITTDNNGFITSKQSLDTTTAGGRFIGKSNRGELGQIAIEQTATGADGGYIRFSTSPSGSTSPAERLRIDSSGNLIIGATAVNGPDGGNATGIVAAHNGRFYTSTANGGNVFEFNVTGTGGVGSINVSGSSTSFNTSSDYRLKENVTTEWDATTRLKQLNPVRFNFIADADTTVDGFLAHEVQSIVPEAISGTHNEVDDEGNPVYQGIDQAKIVPLLVKTIQELEARIAVLEAK